MSQPIDIQRIFELLPHRYPFLLLDKVVSYVPHESITALKNVTINEPYFQGHFPGKPVMPGVLMIEALAQAAGVLTLLSHEKKAEVNDLFLLANVERARFRRIVEPGDSLQLIVTILQARSRLWKVSGQVIVENQLVCEAQLMLAKAAS